MRSFIRSTALIFICISLISCASKQSAVYENRTYDFSVKLPAGYQVKEYKFGREQSSVELRNKQGIIDIRAMGAGTMYTEMPFDEYARIAAASEIQNYEKLISIEAFVTDTRIRGYRTYWLVYQTVPPEDFDKPEDLYPPYIAGPIYYFPPKELKFSGGQPVKTIMLSHYAFLSGEAEQAILSDLEKIARSLKYIK
jgi:hypothetical protein